MAILAELFLVGCAARKSIEGFTPRGFIEIEHEEHVAKPEGEPENSKLYPFDYTWKDPESTPGQYSKIQLAPINLEFIDPKAWEDSLSSAITGKSDYDKEVKQFSDYFASKLRDSISKATPARFVLAETPAADTLRIEIALTSVSFGSPASYAASFASPIPGTGVALDAVRSYLATFEMRLVDSESGKIIATVADQRSPRIRPIDLNKLAVSSPLKEVADIWADEITRSLNAPPHTKVERASRFSIMPW